MRIFFASQSFYPSIGGVSTYLYNLARELESTGNEVAEIHLRQPGESDEADVGGINVFRVPKEPLDRALLQGYYRFKELIYNESHFNKGLFNRPAEEIEGYEEFSKLNDVFGNQIRQLLENHPGEIVHVHDFQLLYLYKFIPRGIPLIFTWHIPLAKNVSKQLAQFLVHHLSQFDKVVFSSPDYIKTANRLGLPEDKTELIYPICNTHLFAKKRVNKTRIKRKYKIPLKSKVVLSVQRIDAKSGHKCLISIFDRVSKHVPRAHLVFAGGQSLSSRLSDERKRYEAEINKLISDLNLEKKITFTGTVPYEELVDLYNASDIYALLSGNEGFGLSITEAMACGLPVIGSRAGGIPEQVKHRRNGYLVDLNGDYSLTVKRMVELLKDKSLRTRMGKESLKIVNQKFKLEYGVEKHLAIYTSLKLKMHGASLLNLKAKEGIEAIVTDFDRTITDRPGRVNLELLDKLSHITSNLILATGRSIGYVKKLAHRFKGWRCIIAEEGAVIYFPETKKTITFSSVYMRQARKRLREVDFSVKRGRVIVVVKTPRARSVRRLMGERLMQHLDELENADEREFVPKDVNKAKSLLLALQLLNINPEKILIVGDGENDADLFRLPGFKVAVANAHSCVKRLADFVTEKPSTQGVKQVAELLQG